MDGEPFRGRVHLLDSASKRERFLLALLSANREDEHTHHGYQRDPENLG
jgi:hypothetical protein